VARALAMSPSLLLADEPTGNLDTKSADSVFALLRKVSTEQGTSVLFVTHNPELAERCDKTLQVIDGKMV
jgi:lipoprotein-releasing system ATP-binding protein